MAPELAESPRDIVVALFQLAEVLERLRLRYALIGGLAVGFRSSPRYTQDVDLILDVPQLVLPSLLEDLQERGFGFDLPTTIREWTREHMTVLSFGAVRIDWLKPLIPLYRHVLDQSRLENWLGHPIHIASSEGLILTKLLAFRGQDQIDIESLLGGNRERLDLDWIRREWQTVADLEDPRMQRFNDMVARLYLPLPNTEQPEPATNPDAPIAPAPGNIQGSA
jgi:hypothetical protein